MQTDHWLIRLLFRFLYSLQIHRLLLRMRRRNAVVLMYHGFSEGEIREGVEGQSDMHLDVGLFCSQAEYLAKHFSVISLESLVRHRGSGEGRPPNALVLTADDGYRSNYLLAYPVLERRRLPMTVFLATDFVEKREFLWVDRVIHAVGSTDSENLSLDLGDGPEEFPLGSQKDRADSALRVVGRLKSLEPESREQIVGELEEREGVCLTTADQPPDIYMPLEWDQVRQMLASSLVSIGAHTCSHTILTRCSEPLADREIVESRTIIEQRTGGECRLFCYPNGGPGDFSPATKEMLKKAGFTCALTTVPGANDRDADVYELKRIGARRLGGREFVVFLALYRLLRS